MALQQDTTKSSGPLSQWVTSVLNVESKSRDNLSYLNTILGPITENLSHYNGSSSSSASDSDLENNQNSILNESKRGDGFFTHEIIFKINEKVFIESLNIYEKVVADSSILKIEALEIDDNKAEKWFLMWDTPNPLPPLSKPKVFTPNITQTHFRTDTIRFTISGNLQLIDAIEVKGNKLPIENKMDKNAHNEEQKTDAFKDYSLYARHLFSLVNNDLFADVFFEVEGQIIAAHRNILVFRSEYFKAMIGSNGSFKESLELNKLSNKSQIKPIYIKDMKYDVFLQIINYLYTGHINDQANIPFYTLLGIMKSADLMNLDNLVNLCLFHFSEMITPENVIKIYKEANEYPDVLQNVINMCHDVITTNFAKISRSADFCSLPQEPMLKIIENVVPRLARLNSEIVNNQNNNETNSQNYSPTDDLTEELHRTNLQVENSDSDDYDD